MSLEDVLDFLRSRQGPIRAEQNRIATKLLTEFHNPARFGMPADEVFRVIARGLAEGKY